VEHKDFDFEIDTKSITEDGMFEGYASTFGGKPDSGGDVVHRGAFLETIEKRGRNGTGVPILWQHNSQMPIGKYTSLLENDKGLKVQGKLTLGTTQGKDAYELLKDGVIKAMSIGYDAIDHERDKRGIRHLRKLDLWEISLVTFPMNTRAHITAIKEATNERQFEKALREAGLSIQASKWLISNCKNSLRDVWNRDNEGLDSIIDSLRSVNKSIAVNSMLAEIKQVNENLRGQYV